MSETFTLASQDIAPNSTITQPFLFTGCGGQNISPELHWNEPPNGCKSFAITVYDPDAPTGSGWWHWLLYNLPANLRQLPQNAGNEIKLLPSTTQRGRNDYGQYIWGGPCPPVGDPPHHYIFSVFALDVEKIELPIDASAAMIGFNLNAHALAKASFTAYYGR